LSGSGLIGVTGATGEVGTRVARRLAERGARMRLIARDASRAPAVEGAEVRVASSYGAREEMEAALAGVETLFLVPGRESVDRVEQHGAAVAAAADAGVARIVYLSFVGAADSSFTLGREHGATEEIVRGSGLEWSFPRMNLYMDFIPSMVGDDGVIRGPAGEGRLAAVLRDDIARAVAVVLTEPGHEGRAYSLTGPEAFTLGEAAAEMSRAGGRRVSFVDETLEEARASRARFGAPDWEVEAWISSYVAIARGELCEVSGDIERLTGVPPKGLREWLAEAGAGGSEA
jgi:NAD(P)H dehydrogenase (quinone)